ncbi:hypothetical protein REPUB_Repub16aG0057600 [Reevesia pubescens]
MQKQQATGSVDPHVAVLAFPFGTHASPILTITRRLAAAAPNTLFSFFSTAQSNASLFSTSQPMLPNIKAYNVWDGIPEGYDSVGKPVEDIIELFMEVARENFRKGMEVAVAETGRKLSCLVTDAFLWFGKDMAEENGVAWVRVRDLPEGIVSGNLESIFCRMVHQMGQVLPQAAAVFINSFEELDHVITNDMKTKFKKFLNVGLFILSTPPPAVPDSHGCLAWLDKQKPETVAYISFGSVATPPPNELVALAEALEASRVPFLWSLRDKAKVHLPAGFLDRANGIVVPWAPQIDVLAHSAVGVFISHGGYNSMLESIAAGRVPMIVRPFFGDHGLNGRMIEDVWEIGVNVKDGIFTKNGVMSCLDLVLAQEKGKKMRENLKAIKEIAQRAVEPEGSSTENFKALLDLVSN